jgi:hypothetical protein
LLAAAAGAVLAVGSVAQAQSNWASPVDGSWFDVSRWTSGVPLAATPVTLGLSGPYTVSLQNNGGGQCGTLTISNPSVLLSIFDNAQLSVGGNIVNAGLIQISGPGAPGNLTRLAVNSANVVHSGGGVLRLAANGNGDNDSAYITNFPGCGLTNAAGSTVAGAGRIYAPFNNSGAVNADQSGKGLFLLQSGKTNDGLMTATNGGVLQLRTSMTQTNNGIMQSSDNSPVQIVTSGAVVSGGTLNGAGVNSGIQYFGFCAVDGVTMQGVNAVNDAAQVNIGAAGVVNNGTWTISNPAAPGNATRIATGGVSTTISGNGSIRLQGQGSGNGDNDSAYITYSTVADVLTNAASHSIRGYGRVYAPLSNLGTVNADIAGKGIFMIDRPKWNNSTMTASNGGVLQFRTSLTQNASGVVLSSDNSPVQFVSWGLVEGGTLNGAGSGGGVQFYGSGQLNSVTLLNNSMVMDATQVNIREGGVINNGLWVVSNPAAPGNATRISTGGTGLPTNATISGTGTIRLQGVGSGNGDNDSAYLTYGTASDVLTNAAGHSITGYGRIYSQLVNNGAVNADVAGKGIFMRDRPKTNNGTMTASNGGVLQFNSVTVTGNPAAQIISTDAASPVQMVNATMTGGGFTTSGTGLFQYFGSNSLSNLTVNGTHQIEDAALVSITTDITNNGTWLISKPAAPGNATRLNASANVTINGTGTIRLQGVQSGNGDNDSAYLAYSAVANTLTLGANQQVRGYGRVFTRLVNDGTIHADNSPNASGPASKGIVLLDQPKTNNGTITSSNAGFWYVRGITLTNGSSGVMSSTNTTTSGGGFENCTIIGGSLTNTAGQSFGTAGTVTFDGPTITPGSSVLVNDASALTLAPGGIINNGTLFVQRLNPPGNATRIIAPAAATIAGSGTTKLQAMSLNSDSSYLWGQGDAANPLTIGAAQTLAGSGRLYGNITIRGTISPDQPFGTPGPISRIDVVTSGTKILTSESTYACQIASTSSYDQIGGNGALQVGGLLQLSVLNAFDPPTNSTYDVVSGPTVTGQFDSVIYPPLSANKRGFVIYGPNYVRVFVTCYANCDGSTGAPSLTANDFQCFLNKFAMGDPYANCDGSTGTPALTANDFQCFLNKFAAGCF